MRLLSASSPELGELQQFCFRAPEIGHGLPRATVVRVRRAYLRVFAPPSGTGKGDPGGA
ncbi:hypothetical protein BD311DRAFT_747520 [Dichomitus squalens]|uniref:Uncharacterized protein n=1 Tax=Dichomitus squalens TaxID=114155 RepID=A0A4Q9N5E6_9APHY|nr:hypothetical protein BD311DRAFT_747520 [Dichomitus squalens]